jgi:hypothetical protein
MTSLSSAPVDPKALASFAEFYPFYLGEHSNRSCRRLHFMADWVMYKDIWTGLVKL